MERYFLSISHVEGSEVEVTRQQWIQAERGAGFWPKDGGNGLATGGFYGAGIHGRIEYAPLVREDDDE